VQAELTGDATRKVLFTGGKSDSSSSSSGSSSSDTISTLGSSSGASTSDGASKGESSSRLATPKGSAGSAGSGSSRTRLPLSVAIPHLHPYPAQILDDPYLCAEDAITAVASPSYFLLSPSNATAAMAVVRAPNNQGQQEHAGSTGGKPVLGKNGASCGRMAQISLLWQHFGRHSWMLRSASAAAPPVVAPVLPQR
jgi:hypothetical protein